MKNWFKRWLGIIDRQTTSINPCTNSVYYDTEYGLETKIDNSFKSVAEDMKSVEEKIRQLEKYLNIELIKTSETKYVKRKKSK